MYICVARETLLCVLYVSGKLKDYVKCLECGYESARADSYLDIPLTIRPFGFTQAYRSVVSTQLCYEALCVCVQGFVMATRC